MSISSTTLEPVNWLHLLKEVRHIIFDLNSLPYLLEKNEVDSFHQIIRILIERDFQLTLIFDDPEYFIKWENEKLISTLKSAGDLEEIQKNKMLFSTSHFWITENPELQNHLSQQSCYFAYKTSESEEQNDEVFSKDPIWTNRKGLYYQHLSDLLEFFNPSQQTAAILSEQILKIKMHNPEKPLIVGVGGPEEAGHAFFIGALLEELEKSDCLIEGIDLTEILSSEFYQTNYWRSTELQHWMMKEVLEPFSQGEQVLIEKAPPFAAEYETNLYPFFLAPEMILIIWGSTLFLPQFQKIIDWNILLELSPKVATARIFGVDEREDFDPDFIQQYEKNDGKLYQEYLNKFEVRKCIQQKVDFNNYHAFRLADIGD